ncbi:UNVERIFIED_CONTAM: hypothetical protein FKN15_007784 [Acipenser sinensis]
MGKVFEESERNPTHLTGRTSFPLPSTPKEETMQTRPKQDSLDGDPSSSKNSYNNPAYYILEGVPNPAAAMSPESMPGSALPPIASKGPAAPGKNKTPAGGATQQRRQTGGRSGRLKSEEGSSEEDGTPAAPGSGGTLNRPPPDFPPPPLPKTAMDMTENPFYASSKEVKMRSIYPDLADIRIPAHSKPLPSPGYLPPASAVGGGAGAFCLDPPPSMSAGGFRRGGGSTGLDDQSCSVLQMAKSLSEVEYQPCRDRNPPLPLKGMAPPSLRNMVLPDSCRTFPPHAIRESIEEVLSEEVSWQGGSSSSSLSFESSVGDWLRRLGLERYEEGLLHNGWDDLEFLSDITEEDLEEAGVNDPAHKKIILENLKLQK